MSRGFRLARLAPDAAVAIEAGFAGVAARLGSVGFGRGLPLGIIELKKPGVPARAAFDENLTHYRQQIPARFWLNALPHRLERRRQPRRLAHGGLGAVLSVEADRAQGRAAPGVAGGDPTTLRWR